VRLVLYGVSSPYAADAVETAVRLGWELAACIRNVSDGEPPPELPSVLGAEDVPPELLSLPFLVPLMKPAARRAASEDALARGFRDAATMIDPTATVARSARVGPGSYVNAQAILAAGAIAGAGCAINRGASIGHHTELGGYASIGPGAVTGGACRIGAGAFLGVGAILAPEVTVGAGAIVGAGAVVIADVAPGSTVVGNPARPIRRDDPSGADL
jgi:sugar O-acyltransferase (sialic acid O-acetyltransferase NeuD family)